MSDNPEGVLAAMGERVEEVVDIMLGRRNAKRAEHYQAVFHGEGDEPTYHGEKVLADLARFCRANESTYHSDPRAHALLEGRREVFLRICEFLKIDQRVAADFIDVEVKDE